MSNRYVVKDVTGRSAVVFERFLRRNQVVGIFGICGKGAQQSPVSAVGGVKHLNLYTLGAHICSIESKHIAFSHLEKRGNHQVRAKISRIRTDAPISRVSVAWLTEVVCVVRLPTVG